MPDLPKPRPSARSGSAARAWKASTCASGRWRAAACAGRPPRGFPHRGAGPGQGADGEEHRDRAGGQQGRLLRQAAAGPGADRDAWFNRRRGLLRTFIPRPAGRHRQPVGGRKGAAAGRRGPPTMATTRTWWWRPTGHRHLLRHRQRHPAAGAYGFWLDDAFASGGGSVVTTTRAWASPRAAPGSRSSATSASSAAIARRTTSPASASATCPATCSATACCCQAHPPGGRLRPPPYLHRPDPDAAASFKERARMFALPRSSWDDYDAA